MECQEQREPASEQAIKLIKEVPHAPGTPSQGNEQAKRINDRVS